MSASDHSEVKTTTCYICALEPAERDRRQASAHRAKGSGCHCRFVQFAGMIAERWFFFAQANHPQNLYYRKLS